jgi:lysozyme
MSKKGFACSVGRYQAENEKGLAGLPSIGVGHLLTQNEFSSGKILIQDKVARYADGLTKSQVIQLLA